MPHRCTAHPVDQTLCVDLKVAAIRSRIGNLAAKATPTGGRKMPGPIGFTSAGREVAAQGDFRCHLAIERPRSGILALTDPNHDILDRHSEPNLSDNPKRWAEERH